MGRLSSLVRLRVVDGYDDHDASAYIHNFKNAVVASRLSLLDKTKSVMKDAAQKVVSVAGFRPVLLGTVSANDMLVVGLEWTTKTTMSEAPCDDGRSYFVFFVFHRKQFRDYIQYIHGDQKGTTLLLRVLPPHARRAT